MTLNQFLKQFDKENTYVLLEGKRNVLKRDESKLFALGNLLASRTHKIIFRSGNASGADKFFSDGVCSVDKNRLQVITPYTGHRQKQNQASHTISLSQLNYTADSELVQQSKSNRKMERMIEQFVEGDVNRYSIKAAYILRDTAKVIGAENINPAAMGIFYDDLTNPRDGGTGHTMNICIMNDIPYIDQSTWFDWLK